MATDRGRHPLRRRAHLVAQYVKCPAPGDIVVEYIGRQGNWRLCRSELGTTGNNCPELVTALALPGLSPAARAGRWARAPIALQQHPTRFAAVPCVMRRARPMRADTETCCSSAQLGSA